MPLQREHGWVMTSGELRRPWAALFLGVSLTLAHGVGTAAASTKLDAPSLVELVFVDLPGGDPLAARIRTLFPAKTAVLSRRSVSLDAASVLQPSRPDTLRIWIRFSDPNQVRIYMAAANESAARYLIRDFDLDRGLDEVGGESLAQVVHSAAEALWSGEQQLTHADAARTLAEELPAPPSSERPRPPQPAAPPIVAAKDELSEARESPPARSSTTSIGLGATFGSHFGAAEGWLNEPGGFIIARYGKLSLRLDGGIVLPADIELRPVNVRVTGAVGGVRVGWQGLGSGSVRLRLEAGLGAWAGRWRAALVAEEPAAHVSPAQGFLRPFAVGAFGLEWWHGPVWLAARAELRGHFNRSEYTVAGQGESVTSSYLEPGGALELGASLGGGTR
jgi:hypothetical protein